MRMSRPRAGRWTVAAATSVLAGDETAREPTRHLCPGDIYAPARPIQRAPRGGATSRVVRPQLYRFEGAQIARLVVRKRMTGEASGADRWISFGSADEASPGRAEFGRMQAPHGPPKFPLAWNRISLSKLQRFRNLG